MLRRAATAMPDLFATNPTLLIFKGESGESGGPKLGIGCAAEGEDGEAGLKLCIHKAEWARGWARVAELARTHEVEEGNPHHVDEGLGLGVVQRTETGSGKM